MERSGVFHGHRRKLGAQFGVEDIQLVMMVMTDEGMRHLLQDKFQVGGSASAAAGPVGRHASAGTDWKVDTSILTYSRAHGLFVGIDLEGSWIERDKDSTLALYGKERTNTELLTGRVSPPHEARPFLAEVRRVKSPAKRRVIERMLKPGAAMLCSRFSNG